jgi:hypothetical protein
MYEILDKENKDLESGYMDILLEIHQLKSW